MFKNCIHNSMQLPNYCISILFEPCVGESAAAHEPLVFTAYVFHKFISTWQALVTA